MAYRHGVYASEVPTSITPTVTSSTIPVVFGSAPVNMSQRETPPVNEPVLCFTYAEAVETFGYSDNWDFTLCEAMFCHFSLFGASPIILVNVLDPATMNESVSDQPITLNNDIATIEDVGIVLDSVVVKLDGEDPQTYNRGDDYELNFDNDGNVVIQRIDSGAISAGASLKVDYDKLDPSAVDKNDIIGGIDVNGNPTGLELLNEIFPRFREVPGMVLAPGFSHDPTVAAVMVAKAGNINNTFECIALTDISTGELKNYTNVPAWKENNNFTDKQQINTWPKLKLDDRQFHMSTQLASLICVIDAENGNVPYISPSNHNFQANGTALEDGTEIFLGPDQAAYLNGNGVVTALNFIGGWKAWGNRTGAYPGVTDPKDSFIPVRRMFNWIKNSMILTYWQQLDAPIRRRLVDAVTDSLNLWLNGLTSQDYILGGRVEFNESENSQLDLMDGIVRFHVYVTPPSPAREIDFIVEYDASYLSNLFTA